jgi:hypothetical protein
LNREIKKSQGWSIAILLLAICLFSYARSAELSARSPATQAGSNQIAAFLNMTTATTTEIVPLTSGEVVYVTALNFLANGTTTVKFVKGTGTNCGTGTTDLTPTYNLTAQTGMVYGSGVGVVMPVTAGNALCVVNGSAVNLQVMVTYIKY